MVTFEVKRFSDSWFLGGPCVAQDLVHRSIFFKLLIWLTLMWAFDDDFNFFKLLNFNILKKNVKNSNFNLF